MDIGNYCFHLSLQTGICGRSKKLRSSKTSGKLCVLSTNFAAVSRGKFSWSKNNAKRIHRRVCTIPSRNHQMRCYCFLNAGPSLDIESVKKATLTLARAMNNWKGSPVIIRVASALGVIIFAIWGLGPLVQKCRNTFLRLKNPSSDSSWKRSSTYHVTTSYVQPLLLWIGAMFICRALDPMVLPSEVGHVVKARVLNFVRSLSTVLAFAHCLSSVIQQAQRFFVELNDLSDARNMGFHFASRAVNAAVWVAAVSLFMELLGFSTQKWVTAGGLGTVLLTLAGREILTNFLSSAMIQATRPFVLYEWIQTKIEGYEVSGTVEHIGWWSPTIIRGDDREAIHIPNHKFTVNIVRNLSQKTHWRIKTHLAISHLDVGKINNIVADMRKVLAKNPQVEQQKLHRRVFLDYINPENQALTILVSCFVKTSHFEEYLCVQEGILLDLLRVITHHRARLATPIRTVQKIYTKADLDDAPFPDSVFTHGAVSNDRFLLIEPSYDISADDRTKIQGRPASVNGHEDRSDKATTPRSSTQSTSDSTDDSNSEETESSAVNTKEIPATSDAKTDDSPMSRHSQRHEATLPSSVPQQDLSEQIVAKSSLEENLVLGVALDGSKRTLPIEEEDIVPSSNLENSKDLAALRSSANTAAVTDDKSDPKPARGPEASPVADQLDQQV